MKKQNKKTAGRNLISLIILAALLFFGGSEIKDSSLLHPVKDVPSVSSGLEELPEYEGEPYVTVNDNEPEFDDEDFTTESFEQYSPLDSLGRCGAAYANIGTDLMPRQERDRISQIHPTGWHSTTYDFIDGELLYNRCHLIAFQLSGENANERNLITGTRYMNADGMLPFEEEVGNYVRETGNHVLYRATPVFEGSNLVASGVQLEAESVEDQGRAISFNVYIFNVQPGVDIDYSTGDSRLEEDPVASSSDNETSASSGDYVLNTFSRKFHLPSCDGAASMNPANKEYYSGSREELLEKGYSPCGSCQP